MDLSNIVVLDCEATGLDVTRDRVIQIGMVRGELEYNQLINPGIPIPAEVQELTGITDAMVKDAPAFKDVVDGVLSFLGGYDWAGFNLNGYDLPLLAEECGRAGRAFKWQGRAIIDASTIFKKKESRTLSAAMKFYCDSEHEGAHSALADAIATRRVLEAQVLRYADLSANSAEELAAYSCYEPRVDLAGKLTMKDGVVVYNFGKAKGVPVLQDVGFGNWVLRNNFTADTKAILAKILNSTNRTEEMPF